MNKEILVLNNVSDKGLKLISDYQISKDQAENPAAILLRSQNLHEYDFNEDLLAVGRAGAGVNNIPIDKLSEQGVVVFNTPGANANAVKELVISAMLAASRNLFKAHKFTNSLTGDEETFHKETEANKKKFAGSELKGKTLGIIGLGAIGVMLANTAEALGLKVIGFDPKMTIANAWKLSASVQQATSADQVYQEANFISFHVPLNKYTEDLFNADHLSSLQDGTTLLNFSRSGIVNYEAVKKGIESGKIKYYCSDFPHPDFVENEQVISYPHLGASTAEAEENCATMICLQVQDFLDKGIITNSVNLPEADLAYDQRLNRISVINRNIPNMLAEMSGVLGKESINIVDMLNRSKGDYAYTIIDTDTSISEDVMAKLTEIEGVIKARLIPAIS